MGDFYYIWSAWTLLYIVLQLLYTFAPDSEGTLGGLVGLGTVTFMNGLVKRVEGLFVTECYSLLQSCNIYE